MAPRPCAGPAVLYVVRHGDRFDYANPHLWASAASSLGFEKRDRPLSPLGHRQARQTAAAIMDFTAGRIDRVLSSPYLRVIQTAQPLCHASGVKLQIEEGLAETGHIIGSIPPASQRFPIFPEVDVGYTSRITAVPTVLDTRTGRPAESYPFDYFARLIEMATILNGDLREGTTVLFTHAASVALVAALTGTALTDVGKFAPCGVFKLTHGGDTASVGGWTLERSGGDNSAYVDGNSPDTYPWGFGDSRITPSPQAVWEDVQQSVGLGASELEAALREQVPADRIEALEALLAQLRAGTMDQVLASSRHVAGDHMHLMGRLIRAVAAGQVLKGED